MLKSFLIFTLLIFSTQMLSKKAHAESCEDDINAYLASSEWYTFNLASTLDHADVLLLRSKNVNLEVQLVMGIGNSKGLIQATETALKAVLNTVTKCWKTNLLSDNLSDKVLQDFKNAYELLQGKNQAFKERIAMIEKTFNAKYSEKNISDAQAKDIQKNQRDSIPTIKSTNKAKPSK